MSFDSRFDSMISRFQRLVSDENIYYDFLENGQNENFVHNQEKYFFYFFLRIEKS